MFAREGYPFILGAAALAAIAFALALRLRSWPLWLVALSLAVVALGVAWFFRNPTRLVERGTGVAVATARMTLISSDSRVNPFLHPDAKWRVQSGQRTVTGDTVIALPVT